MRTRIFLLGLAASAVLGLAGPAAAAPSAAERFPVVVKAYEARLGSLRLPGNVSGTLSFKACSDCEYQTVRVTPATRYEADGRVYTLEDFRQAVAAIGNRRKASVTVKHHLASDTITVVRVTTPASR